VRLGGLLGRLKRARVPPIVCFGAKVGVVVGGFVPALGDDGPGKDVRVELRAEWDEVGCVFRLGRPVVFRFAVDSTAAIG
jgi:hypothetical protein